jgi:hypothetical protein
MSRVIDRFNGIVNLTPLHECHFKLQRESVAIKQAMSRFLLNGMDTLLRAVYDVLSSNELTLHEVMKYCRLLH